MSVPFGALRTRSGYPRNPHLDHTSLVSHPSAFCSPEKQKAVRWSRAGGWGVALAAPLMFLLPSPASTLTQYAALLTVQRGLAIISQTPLSTQSCC